MLSTALLFGFLLPTTRNQKFIASAILLLFLAIYGSMIGGYHDIVDRFREFTTGAESRFAIWLASISMLKSHLVTGIGMGGYEFLSFLYLEGVPERVWYDRAHNEYLELAIELGLPLAVTLYIWFAAGLFRYFRFVASTKQVKDKIRKMSLLELFSLAAFCSLTAFFLHGFVDFVWRLPVNVFFMITFAALLSSASRGVTK